MSEPTPPRQVVVADKPRRRLLVLRIATLVAAVVVILALLPAFAAVVYTPDCSRCHKAEVAAQKTAPHAKLACLSCHRGSTAARRFAFRETLMYGMILKVVPLSGSQASVANASCSSCHSANNIGKGDNSLLVKNGIKIAHVPCTKGQLCTSCHGGVGHLADGQIPTVYQMSGCVSCHSHNGIDSSTCSNCHEGSLKNNTKTSGKFSLSTFSTTHGANWQQKHGAGDLSTCKSCHPQSDCARCHGALVPHDNYILKSHGKVAADPAAAQKCYGCHKDKKFCDDCHQTKMPHPANYLTTHAAEAKKIGEEICQNCHLKKDCDTCHAAHIHPGGAKL
ncbi:MAG: hypothetical protein FWC54_03480 [Actinomycetia bacterium]|nr:hypothetical protein [Actinomycetes bacterium]